MKLGRFLRTSFITCVIAVSPFAAAVDGYKELKFGMTKDQVTDMDVCEFEEEDSGFPSGVEYLTCDDFPFAGGKVDAGVMLLDDKLMRIAMSPAPEKLQAILGGLMKKYGNPSSASSQEEFNAIDNQPNREAFVAFDNNTIYLKLSSDQSRRLGILLIYTDAMFDQILSDKRNYPYNGDL